SQDRSEKGRAEEDGKEDREEGFAAYQREDRCEEDGQEDPEEGFLSHWSEAVLVGSHQQCVVGRSLTPVE
ncbi:MAG: hypothetical protein KDB84_02190, partial [Flavobacteriales bacterium]|nr:hypothetical protein [Flavobacteriales bacterium]